MHPKQTKNTLRTKTESSADRHTDRSKTEVCTGWVLTRRQPQTDQQVQTQRAQTAVSARARQKSGLRGGWCTQQSQTQGCKTEVCAGAGTWGIPAASSKLEEADCPGFSEQKPKVGRAVAKHLSAISLLAPAASTPTSTACENLTPMLSRLSLLSLPLSRSLSLSLSSLSLSLSVGLGGACIQQSEAIWCASSP